MTWDDIPRVVTLPTGETYISDRNSECRVVLERGEVYMVWMEDGKDVDATDAVRVPVSVVRALVGLR